MSKGLAWMLIVAAQTAAAAAPSRPEFHRQVYALHEKQVAHSTVTTSEETGQYNGVAAQGYGYRITSYYDAKTGRLLSRIQRDAALPEAIHISEVYIHDAQGRVTRSYLSIAPPWNPTHPSNAYLNWHHYPGKLHSWRQFELDGQVNYESCEGELDGKPVRIALPWQDMNKDTTSTPEYRACFDGMRTDWRPYITPR